MVYVFLADGFEEIEALATVDIIRRAEIPVSTVGVGGKFVTGSHGIKVESDILPDQINRDDLTAVILPGGMPGSINLENSDIVKQTVMYAHNNKKIVAAICAAPMVLGHLGILNDKKATCYSGFEKELTGADVQNAPVCIDGNIITAWGAGAAMGFALEIVTAIYGNDKRAKEIYNAMRSV